MAPSGGPQGHSSLHDCTGRGHIGWKRGEVVPSTNHARCGQYTGVYKTSTYFFQNGSRFTKQRHQSTREIPTGVLFPQVLYSHRCSIPQSCTFGGWGLGAGVLVGWTGQRSATEHKSLRSPVRKPVARLRPKNHFATLPMKTCEKLNAFGRRK